MRKTKIVGFSIPPELNKRFVSLVKKKHKTKSEFFREMLDLYFKTMNSSAPEAGKINPKEADLAKILKSYWQLRSKASLKVIIVALAIVVFDNKVLIGARKEKDKWVENLTWVFPGGKINSLDFSEEIKREVKQETGLEVKVNNLVGARIHPDAGFKSVQIAALYFHCSPTGRQKLKAGGDLSRLKWVKPTDVFRYFTTSTSDEVTKFLMTIEKSS